MPANFRSPTVRWAALSLVVLTSLFIWRKPYVQEPLKLSDSTTTVSQDHIPKTYQENSDKSHDHLVSQPGPGAHDKIPENSRAPSFPAFKTLSDGLSSQLYQPYPDYNSRLWKRKWKGVHASCQGPRGVDVNNNEADMLKSFNRHPQYNFPRPTFGSFAGTALDYFHCFDRYTRYNPYGFGEGATNEGGNKAKRDDRLDWEKVDWGQLQSDCLSRNLNRYEPVEMPNHTTFWLPTTEDTGAVDSTLYFGPEPKNGGWWSSRASFKERSAVVIHMEPSTEWSIDASQYFRSLIMELSLHSGAEYEVIFLVDVKDSPRSIFADLEEYVKTLAKSAPDEFRNNTLLYNRGLVEGWYSKVPKQKDDSMTKKMNMNQALQLLSLLRPDIEHFWHFESDARYTGHHYQHLETISAWSKNQPRRLLWERSSRYYISGVQDNWATFAASFENTTSNGGIWGPFRAEGIEPIGPDPPTKSPNQDNYIWGVDEEADLITMAPIVESTGSGFPETMSTYPQGGNTPSRLASLPIMARFSKRLLRAMHYGQATLGTSMPATRYPASTALHHGLKAVAFPMPIFLDYAKTPQDVDTEYNFDLPGEEVEEGRNVHETIRRLEEVAERMTFSAEKGKDGVFGDEIYKRWLGYGKDPTEKLCLPGIMLHPIKNV